MTHLLSLLPLYPNPHTPYPHPRKVRIGTLAKTTIDWMMNSASQNVAYKAFYV